ncbi:protein kinase [Bifidobacterium sp. ESL0784]|uniref:serine/threonine-protein kinase n=1 Tax=Bifidobacterium sp. ESL0784 TaxID=2983231 RepID=UPI0023F7C205|nr:serine/threonine protein kinase [Bifidobacterium sp. ESL0784]MDF7640085.1 protein kinase [Bifidobacterium sp. ESL0784]
MSDLNALDLQPGEIVGGYTLISRLGGGAMGSVWRVRDDGGQIYAMKILRDSLKDDDETDSQDYQNSGISDNNASDDYGNTTANGNGDSTRHHHSHDPHVTARERMRREAVAMRKVHHPGVCAIVDMELDDSLAFIVTELIEGKNLRDDVAANGRYVGNDLQRLAAKLIDAVRAVHAQGIIHRDIKPTNVMISASGPVLVDFGIAMTAGESHVTRTGLVMGTPGFIAPEIIDGAESNEATDWWSLASVIAFAATGRPVFGSKPMMAVLEREASGNANLAGLPPNTLNALRGALDPDPAKRCNPDQLLQAITLDALNPFENGELDDEDENVTGNNANGSGGVVPPFGQTPRPDSDPDSGSPTTSNPRTNWTDDIPLSPAVSENDTSERDVNNVGTKPMAPQSRQIRGSTRAMPQGDNKRNGDAAATIPLVPSTGTMPLSTEMTRSLEPTSPLSSASPQDVEQTGAGTVPMAIAPLAPGQQQVPGAQYPTPYIYGQPNAQPGYMPQSASAQPVIQSLESEPAVNPADIRRGKLLSRSILTLWLLAIPLALLSASMPMISICCAAILLWFLLTLGYSEEGQLEREGRRGGIRKGGDTALRTVSLPWHILEALLFTIPRALILIVIAGVGPVIVNLVSGLPTHMVALSIGPWHIPFPLPADLSLSYSSASLAVFMAAAWLVTVFGPKATLLRIGAGRLRGSSYPKPDNTIQAEPQPLPSTPTSNKYGYNLSRYENDASDINAEADMNGSGSSKRHSAGHWVLLAIWLILSLAALTLALSNHQINWVPLPTPQL